jgi:hypothetical protein
MTPEMNALFNRMCFNTKGKIKTRNLAETGTIAQVVPKVKQTWQRLIRFIETVCHNIVTLETKFFAFHLFCI